MGDGCLARGRAHPLERPGHGEHTLPHLGIDALPHELPHDTDPKAGDIPRQLPHIVRHGDIGGGRIPWILPGDDRGEQCRVHTVSGESANLVQGGAIADEAIARDAAVGGLQSRDAAEGRRLADGSPRIRPEG